MNLEMKYIIALTNLYGMVNRNKVIEIYNMQNVDQIKLLTMFDENELEKNLVYIVNDYFIHEIVLAYDEEHLFLESQSVKPLYVPEKDELLKYVDGNYFEMNKQYKALAAYLEFEYGLKGKELDEHLFAVYASIISNNNLKEIIESTKSVNLSNPFKNADEVTKLIIDCANNTRSWINNGHTPNELLIEYSESNLDSDEGENDLDPVASFLDEFNEFLTLSNRVIDVHRETNLEVITEICDVFYNVHISYNEIISETYEIIKWTFMNLFFRYLVLCFDEFNSGYEDYDVEVLFVKTFNIIINNSDNYQYSNSKLYENSDWNNQSLEKKDLKRLYCHYFVNDYVKEIDAVMDSDLAEDKKQIEALDILSEYIQDLEPVFSGCFELLDALIIINKEFYSIMLERDYKVKV